MVKINLNSPDIMSAKDASKIWGHDENYVRRMYKKDPKRFPSGTLRKFGKQWVITTEGMEAVTKRKDPRKKPERWKTIPNYKGLYEVSNRGNVKSLDRHVPNKKNGKLHFVKGRMLKPSKRHGGYLMVTLYKDGHGKHYFVHRLVMNAFRPNPAPQHFTQINHKNQVPSDNHLENLEWCTQAYNNNYRDKTKKASKRVAQYDLSGHLIKIWPSKKECGRHGFDPSGVWKCVVGISRKYKGYVWKWADRK